MALNFFKVFEFPNQNNETTLVIVSNGEKPLIPNHLKNYEILEFNTLDEARAFGRDLVEKHGGKLIKSHGLDVVDFYKYGVIAFPTNASEAYGRPCCALTTHEEAVKLADDLHFAMQDSVDECGRGFIASETYTVCRYNE